MYEVLGLLVIILPTLIVNYRYGELCDAGRILAALGLMICYIVGVITIKRMWED